jgi:hypothetical protein
MTRYLLSILTVLFICFGSKAVLACDVGPGHHTVETASLKARHVYIEFTAQDKSYALVRAATFDENGFVLKDKQKSAAERKKFDTQFDLKSAVETLKLYDIADKLRLNQFKEYQFGLFSIYQLGKEHATFVGEVNLGDQDILSAQFAELTLDIAPSYRNQKIGRSVVEAVLNKILKPALGQQPWVINYMALRGHKKHAEQNSFTRAKTPLTMVKSKVHFDNFPSHLIHKRLNFRPWHISADYSLVWVYPPAPIKLLLQAMPFVEQLTSMDASQREEGVAVLTNSVKAILDSQANKK